MLRGWLDRARPLFEEQGRLHALNPLFEAVDTLLYTPGHVTRGAAHVRDGLDLKRMMMIVVIALMPCMGMAIYNTGYQSHLWVGGGGAPLPGWQSALYAQLGLGYSAADPVACLVLGALYFVPQLVVTFAVGGAIEVLFASLRKHEVNEGFFVTGFLVPLTLPPSLPLWQLALGVAFGVIFAKEIFGGTGMNFLNPALVVRAFLFFAYPAQISGDVWVAAMPPDAISSATALSQLAAGEITVADLSFTTSFFGLHPGSMGETSTFFCLLGAGLLLLTQVASWRTMLGVVAGAFLAATLMNVADPTTNPMLAVPFHWHLVLGGFAFGTVFMATDPVSSAFTDRGRLLYGVGIGFFAILVRAVNPAYPEGMMLAILFMNVFAPLIDHFVVEANMRWRRKRYGRGAA